MRGMRNARFVCTSKIAEIVDARWQVSAVFTHDIPLADDIQRTPSSNRCSRFTPCGKLMHSWAEDDTLVDTRVLFGGGYPFSTLPCPAKHSDDLSICR